MSTLTIESHAVPAGRGDATAPVRLWLKLVATLIIAMVLVGGLTRLTGSGLSITEWAPVTGAVPPLSDEAWLAAFERYRQAPQYALVNKGMDLAAFKSIFLWEWGHRFLGRLLGLAYLLPLAVFIAQGRVRGRLMASLIAVGLLGGLQGAVGWIMVASGLQPGMVAVAPLKLAIHLGLACALLAAVVALGVLLGPRRDAAPLRLRRGAAVVALLVFIQIILGALVAGHHAGLIYNTWPQMAGALVPDAAVLWPLRPWWTNLYDTVATVQFNHRLGAYVLLAASLWHAIDAVRQGPAALRIARRALWLTVLVLTQAAVGITTLLLVVPLWSALLHQAAAALLLVAAIVHWSRLVR